MIGYHNSQYQPGSSTVTRQSGCTWTTGATGIAVITNGRYAPTPDKLHSFVKRTEETNPGTPGWSLGDLDLALSRYGAIGFDPHYGQGWAAVVAAHGERRFIVIQGDSDQFSPRNCSGAFDGLHCVGIGAETKTENGVLFWWLHDPICPTGRWERPGVIRRYAEKLSPSVLFGTFRQKIPVTAWRYVNEPVAGQRSKPFNRYILRNGYIVEVEEHRTAGMDVDCSAPQRVEAAPGKPDVWGRELVTLLIPGKTRNGWHVDARFAREGD
jgi:hypothetical protein